MYWTRYTYLGRSKSNIRPEDGNTEALTLFSRHPVVTSPSALSFLAPIMILWVIWLASLFNKHGIIPLFSTRWQQAGQSKFMIAMSRNGAHRPFSRCLQAPSTQTYAYADIGILVL
jgi:hypothetical protein